MVLVSDGKLKKTRVRAALSMRQLCYFREALSSLLSIWPSIASVSGSRGYSFGQYELEMLIQISAQWCGVGIGRVYAWVTRVKNMALNCQSIKTDVVVELPDSGGQVNQVAEEEPHCWCHLGKGELTNEREQFPLGGLVLG
ncbi:hypothetical protein EMCRGX_G005071 [Ephydatia muelleri]